MRNVFLHFGIALCLFVFSLLMFEFFFETKVFENNSLGFSRGDLSYTYPKIKDSDNIVNEECKSLVQHYLKPEKIEFESGLIHRNDYGVYTSFVDSDHFLSKSLALFLYYEGKNIEDSAVVYGKNLSPFALNYLNAQNQIKFDNENFNDVLNEFEKSFSDTLLKPLAFAKFRNLSIQEEQLWRLKPYVELLEPYYKFVLEKNLILSIVFYFEFLKENISILLFSFFSVFFWIIFFLRANLFTLKKTPYYIGAFVLGASSVLFLFPYIHHFVYYLFPLKYGFFIKCIINIGLVEELVKIFPLLIMLMLMGEKKEPVDFLIFAGMSALGFAFIENTEKLYEYSLSALRTRTILCSIAHAIYSMIFAYFIFIPIYQRKNIILYSLLGLFLSALMHGVWDYLVFAEIKEDLTLLYYAIVILGLWVCIRMFNNVLNVSPNFTFTKNKNYLSIIFVYTVFFILLLEIAYVGYVSGLKQLYTHLYSAILPYTLFLILLVFELKNIRLVRGLWEKITIFSFFRKYSSELFIDKEVTIFYQKDKLGSYQITNQIMSENNEILFIFEPILKVGLVSFKQLSIPQFKDIKIEESNMVNIELVSSDHHGRLKSKMKLNYAK